MIELDHLKELGRKQSWPILRNLLSPYSAEGTEGNHEKNSVKIGGLRAEI
jgi:hypothetical protein